MRHADWHLEAPHQWRKQQTRLQRHTYLSRQYPRHLRRPLRLQRCSYVVVFRNSSSYLSPTIWTSIGGARVVWTAWLTTSHQYWATQPQECRRSASVSLQVIASDWSSATDTLTWRFTSPNPIYFCTLLTIGRNCGCPRHVTTHRASDWSARRAPGVWRCGLRKRSVRRTAIS